MNGKQSGDSDVTGANHNHEESKAKKRSKIPKMFSKNKGEHDDNKSEASDDSDKVKKGHFTFSNQIRGTILNFWINVLLICAPIGIALNYVKSVPPIPVFVVNFHRHYKLQRL